MNYRRVQQINNQKRSALSVIMDLYDINDFGFCCVDPKDPNPHFTNSEIRGEIRERAAYHWMIKEVYDEVLRSNTPPLVTLDSLKARYERYLQFNDIWGPCILAIDTIIELLV